MALALIVALQSAATSHAATPSRCGVQIYPNHLLAFGTAYLIPMQDGRTVAAGLDYGTQPWSTAFFSVLGPDGRPPQGSGNSPVVKRWGPVLEFLAERVARNTTAICSVTGNVDSAGIGLTLISLDDSGGGLGPKIVSDTSMSVNRGYNPPIAIVVGDDDSFWLLSPARVPGEPLVARRIALATARPVAGTEAVPIVPSDFVGALVDAADDGVGGVYVLMLSDRASSSVPDGHAFSLFHLLGNGSRDLRWPHTGCRFARDAGNHPVLVSDGQGGAYVGWLAPSGLSTGATTPTVTRVQEDGRFAPGWTVEGLNTMPGIDEAWFGLDLTVGASGSLVVGARGLTGGFLQGFDGTGRRLPGWPVDPISLMPLRAGWDVGGIMTLPLASDRWLVVWSALGPPNFDMDSFAAVLPLVDQATLVDDAHRFPICTSRRELGIAGLAGGVEGAFGALWGEVSRELPFDPLSGIYSDPVRMVGMRPLPSAFSLVSTNRQDGGARLTWRSRRIFDRVPEVWMSTGGGEWVLQGLATTQDSWTVTADVQFSVGCASTRVLLREPRSASSVQDVSAPVPLMCTPGRTVSILSLVNMQVGEVELRVLNEGGRGDARFSLFDLLGRRVASTQLTLDRDGEYVVHLSSPRGQGVYWAEVRQGGTRVARAVAVVR